jgi:hypothetical protein
MSDEQKRVGADKRRVVELTQNLVRKFAPMQQAWVNSAVDGDNTDFEIHCAMWVFASLLCKAFNALEYAESEEDREALRALVVASEIATSATVPEKVVAKA